MTAAAGPPLLDWLTTFRLRALGDKARDFVQGHYQDPAPGETESERAERAAYGTAVEDVLRWLTGDAPAEPILAAVLGLDDAEGNA